MSQEISTKRKLFWILLVWTCDIWLFVPVNLLVWLFGLRDALERLAGCEGNEITRNCAIITNGMYYYQYTHLYYWIYPSSESATTFEYALYTNIFFLLSILLFLYFLLTAKNYSWSTKIWVLIFSAPVFYELQFMISVVFVVLSFFLIDIDLIGELWE